MRVKTLDFALDNASRNKTDKFTFLSPTPSKIIARRGKVFTFKIELSHALHRWQVSLTYKNDELVFTAKRGDVSGWTVKSSTVDNTSIWRISVPWEAALGIYAMKLSLYEETSDEYVAVQDTFFVIANPFEPRSMVYNESESFLKEYLNGVNGLVYDGNGDDYAK